MLEGDRTLQLWTPVWRTDFIFQSTWTNYSGGWSTVGFYKDLSGRVFLKGLAAAGGPSAPGPAINISPSGNILLLPVGYRPQNNEMFTCMASPPSGSQDTVRVDVVPSGQVYAEPTGSSFTSLLWISLAGISFSIY